MSKELEVLKANENNIVIILKGKKAICWPICKKRDGKFYQINETNFECFHCGENMELVKILPN